MDTIERDLHTYGGIITAAETRAAGLTELLADKDAAGKLKDRGIDKSDANAFADSAATLKADVETMRALYTKIESLAEHLHEESAALADEIRSFDDAARSALGRKSGQLPTLGIQPSMRGVRSHKDKVKSATDKTPSKG